MQPSKRPFALLHYLLLVVLLCPTPLIGVIFLNLPVAQYIQFPPTTQYIVHSAFQRPAFLLLLLFVASICFPFVYRLITYGFPGGKRAADRPFPWWGWAGVSVVLLSWGLAWSRLSFFQTLQRYSFFPLWVGYIMAVNGLTCRRRGACLIRSRRRFFAMLFPASALFWWYFEYLNRFVQNWYYSMGPGQVTATEYILHATICFSTVLPAVLSTYELLRTFPGLADAFADWRLVSIPNKKWIGALLLVVAPLCLTSLIVFPNYLFPLVWIAPLMVIVGLQLATGRPTIFAGVEKGDWRHVVLPALAALICGFFWEMWNWKSLAHWEYSVPFVHRFQIFEMPILGYAGYLPFGLECVAVADLIEERLGNLRGLER